MSDALVSYAGPASTAATRDTLGRLGARAAYNKDSL
jgi:hypothetical protein